MGRGIRRFLEDHLIPFMRIHRTYPPRRRSLPHEQARDVLPQPVHHPRLVKELPGSQPDQELLVVHKEVAEGQQRHHFPPQAVEAIELIWVKDMGLPYFKKLTSSVLRRLQMVVDQKGR
jgi:hypothetical protein